MAKKIFIIFGAIAIVAVVVLGVTTCGVMKVAEEALKEREPQLRQYVQMTESEQNAYVEKNMDELFASISAELKDDEEISKEQLQQLKADPEAKAAGLQLGRSIVAMFIISSDPIVKDLTPEQKDSFQKESDDLSNRLEIYNKFRDGLDKKK